MMFCANQDDNLSSLPDKEQAENYYIFLHFHYMQFTTPLIQQYWQCDFPDTFQLSVIPIVSEFIFSNCLYFIHGYKK